MRPARSALASSLILLLAACASGSAPRPAMQGAAAQGAAEAAADQWEQALLAWREQRDDSAAAALAQANAELIEAAKRCAESAGCESGQVLERYARLLAEQGGDNAGDAVVASDEGMPLAADAAGPQADLPALEGTINLLNGRELRDLITLNEPVRAALNEWLTWMRPQLIEAHENYQFLRHRMWPEYEQAGLPEALLFGILAKESAGKVHAVSHAGAAGPLQFMPATGARFGLGRDASGFDTRFDPQLAARANVRYLNERFREFNSDLALALGAYNGGEGRMQRLYRQSGRKSFWSHAVSGRLPPETRDYVPMVLAAAWLFLHPEDYGLEFPRVDTSAAALRLQAAASINQLSICLGQQGTRSGWFRALRNLNPRHLPHVELPAGTELQVPAPVVAAYAQNCLSGDRAEEARRVAAAAKQHVSSGTVASGYRVRNGDTIASIARRHQCGSPQALAAANGIKGPRFLIKPGQTLRLQGCRS